MAYLHENKEEFLNAVSLCVEKYGILPEIIEKDYYVTMILRLLAADQPAVVFKGGTSLSKCYKVIKRFSEDIDITIDKDLTWGQKKKIKETIKTAASVLGLQIPNIDKTQSRNSYNKYIFEYDTVLRKTDPAIIPSVILETSYAEISFPTVMLPIDCYIGELMKDEAPEETTNFLLDPFNMKVQSLERTLVDKVFAICDYYMKGEVRRHSRHIYDVYKLLPLISQDEALFRLIHEVRTIRAKNTGLCLSAQPGINIPEMLKTIIDRDVYKADYETLTSRILNEKLPYETAIGAIRKITEAGLFEETEG